MFNRQLRCTAYCDHFFKIHTAGQAVTPSRRGIGLLLLILLLSIMWNQRIFPQLPHVGARLIYRLDSDSLPVTAPMLSVQH